MARYLYKAMEADGRFAEGSVEAADRAQAIALLREPAVTLIEVRKAAIGVPWLRFAAREKGRTRLQLRDLVFIAQQLANLLRAGCALDRSLDTIADLTSRAATHDILRKLVKEVRHGKSLADAMTQAEGFPEFFVSMVKAGEASGSLAVVFERLAGLLERQVRTRGRLVSALIYPAILLTTTIGSVILIMTVVVPQFEPIFEQARQELPALTRMVIGLSRLTLEVTPYLIPLAGLLSAFLIFRFRKPAAKLKLHQTLLQLPLIGRVILKSEMAKLSHILGALLEGGVPLVQALSIAQGSLTNLRLRAALEHVRELVKNGTRMTVALDRQRVFPSLLVQLTSIGEESARLGQTLTEVGRIYDDDTETMMQRVVAIVTPAATIGLGGIVAVVLAAILLAVLKINDLAF